MDEFKRCGGVFAAAGVERMAGQRNTGPAAAKVQAKNADAFRAELGGGAEHVAGLV